MSEALTIWVDADATPREVKDVLYRAAKRLEIATVFVANQRLTTPVNNPNVSTVLVGHGPDVADSHIADHAIEGDVAVTADIPLAAILVEQGVMVIDHRGERYTEENVRERLSVRDFMDSLRGTGVETGGPKAYSPQDKRAFADALDRTLTAALRQRERAPARRKKPTTQTAPPPVDGPLWAIAPTSTSPGGSRLANPPQPLRQPVSAAEALARLREGNERFVVGEPTRSAVNDIALRAKVAAGQEPMAVVLGCSDSRVPPEAVFDLPFGELFVVRVAGNVASPEAVGSVEFAAERLGARLVVVLGHSQCGAVQATIDQISRPFAGISPNLASIVERVDGPLRAIAPTSPDDEWDVDAAVAANVASVVGTLRESETLVRLGHDGGLVVIGAVYQLATGQVDFVGDSA